MICNNAATPPLEGAQEQLQDPDRCDCVLHRESPESRALAVPVVSADPLDPWDPLDWPEPPARPDVR